ncbi:hypothetical protein ACE6H2_021361 [Prunus campanulata]
MAHIYKEKVRPKLDDIGAGTFPGKRKTNEEGKVKQGGKCLFVVGAGLIGC